MSTGAADEAEAAAAEAEKVSDNSDKKGLSTGAKIGIGVGVLALIIGGVFLLKRKKVINIF